MDQQGECFEGIVSVVQSRPERLKWVNVRLSRNLLPSWESTLSKSVNFAVWSAGVLRHYRVVQRAKF
jgi:hypothetical protein